MTTDRHTDSLRQFRFVRGAVLLLLAYWTAFAVVVPVTIWDSHTYNLARLLIANYGGLFGNTGWNSDRQVAFPWTFDAIHYPFLFLGWGYALPSFACFAGVMLIVFHLVKGRYGERCAWCCCLAILALPTLMFQATSTKNDMAVVFGVACWAYALWRSRDGGSRGFLFLAALALSFAAGAKSSGIPLLVLLAVGTVWFVHQSRTQAAWFLGSLTVCFILFGSVEIYLNNWITYRHLLGTDLFVRLHQNLDGVRGTTANFIRYTLGSINLGYDVAEKARSPIPNGLADLCRAILKGSGLENKGYRGDFNDSNLQLLKNGWEGGSDFGPLGAFSLLTAGFVLLSRPPKDVLWKLAAAGFVSMLLVCATVAWMPQNMRFLLLPFVLFTLATTILFTAETASGSPGRVVVLILSICSAVLFPWFSFNKNPRSLLLSITDRPAMTTMERPAMLEIVQDLEGRRAEIGSVPVLLVAGGDSWVLPVLQMRDLHIIPSPFVGLSLLRPSPIVDLSLLRSVASRHHTQSVYILLLNEGRPLGKGCAVSLVKKYGEADSGLYIWSADVSPTPDLGSSIPRD